MKRKLNVIFTVFAIMILFVSCSSNVQTLHGEEFNADAYLREYFGAGFNDNTELITLRNFKDELAKVSIDYDGSGDNFIDAAINAAGEKELVGTYDKAKIEKRKHGTIFQMHLKA